MTKFDNRPADREHFLANFSAFECLVLKIDKSPKIVSKKYKKICIVMIIVYSASIIYLISVVPFMLMI